MAAELMRTYLEPDVARSVRNAARAQGRSESAIIAEAVHARLALIDPRVEAAETDTLSRALGRVERRIDKVIWEQTQLKECLLQFVRVWLEYTPPLDEEVEESVALAAEARFARFLQLVANSLTGPQPAGEVLEASAQDPLGARLGGGAMS